jgi:hypothetical protein
MTQPSVPEATATPPARAGIGLRAYVFSVGLAGIAMGLLGLFAMPEKPAWCRWLGYIAGALFVPGGTFLLFLSLRGRKTDLQELTGLTTGKDVAKDSADAASSSVAAQITAGIIDRSS